MTFRTIISYVLWPLTMWYAVGVAVRDFFYAIGLKRQAAPHITTIGVGNLCTGGSGKTPHVEYLLRLLSDRYSTAVLSRGYKRKSKGFFADDGSHNPELLGDEPAMIAAKFPNVQVAVCEKRVEGVHRLMAQERIEMQGEEEVHISMSPQLVILDDVFQHRAIKPSINILLTEYGHPFFKDHILPYGNLREFKSARLRANIVIVTKCPVPLNPVEKHNIVHDMHLLNYQKVFFSYLKYGALLDLDGRPAGVDMRHADNILCVTGIAHPEPMVAELRRSTKVKHMAFGDHHDFSARDMARIRDTFASLPGSNNIIVTTEKDAVRLHGKTTGLPVYVLPVEVAFHKSAERDFDFLVESSVRENISFLSKLSIWS
jgi:tetraacyldisaccharide 4'-kinase